MEIPLLRDLIIIFGLAIAVLFVCNRLRIPTTVGFLLTGVLAGPHGLGLISGVKDVEILAEIGVILLLFTIGIEFSLKGLLEIKRSVFMGGSFQLFFTLLAAFVILKQLNFDLGQSVFIGFLVSLSSTAIVLKLLQERAEIESPHGRSTLGILIFQDVAVVPMMLLVPVLVGTEGQIQGSPLLVVVKGIGIILLVAMSAKWVVPHVLYQIARTRSRELFLVGILLICFAVAWLTNSLGLSLALGAFLAGLIISESEYSHETLGNILPFRDVFTSLFFVSIGMLEDVGFLIKHPGQVVLLTLAIMALKSLVACLAVCMLGLPLRTAILAGLALCQIGEFSFILSMTGVEHGLLRGDIYQLFLAVSVLTMGATPFLMASAPRVADAAVRLPFPMKLKTGFHPLPRTVGASEYQKLQDHLIIVGFGLNGRNVAQAAKVAGIPYVVIEMNPETVRKEKTQGEPIFYGDATHDAVLGHARIKDARVMVVAISDMAATRRITTTADKLNPKLHIIVRTRFVQEVAYLHALGADEVIPEEFETSVEIFTRVLVKYLIPRDEIERFAAQTRAGGYQIFRSLSADPASLRDVEFHLPDVEIESIRVRDGSALSEKTLADIEMRKQHGVTLLAIRRGTQTLSNPGGSTKLLPEDVLILLGPPSNLAAFAARFGSAEIKAG